MLVGDLRMDTHHGFAGHEPFQIAVPPAGLDQPMRQIPTPDQRSSEVSSDTKVYGIPIERLICLAILVAIACFLL